MTTIQLSERGSHDGSFLTRIMIGEGAEYEASVTDPAGAAEEAELAWYFEQHLRFPFLDKDRERAAEQLLERYGEALFEQVLGGDASHDYKRLRAQAFDGCRIEVSGSAAFHRLHWEALRDPELPTPLAVRIPITRRVDRLGSQFDLPGERETLNLLVVTARPDGPADIGYRTISRPLLDALRQANVPVLMDLVRPGTWEALNRHLRAATERHGSGWYQIIHFDLHGALTNFATLEKARSEGTVVFPSTRWEPFDGAEAFLFFETAADRVSEPARAAQVAALLAEHRVPVAVLNACQSAMQSSSEASLAQLLVEAGVPVAVGMAYSVTVSAAVRAIPVIYERLGHGADPVAAVHAARRELFDHRSRAAYFNQTLDLEDWALPVLFRQQALHIRLREMSEPEADQFYQRQYAVGEEPATEYGFIGRDLDIQTIERRLLLTPNANQLLVYGMAGAGKSTLLTHLGWWWQRTGLVDRVFRFSYEDHAWTAAQMVREIGSQLLNRVDQARLDSLSADAQLERTAELLRAHRHLLILDNTESITASHAAIPHALEETARRRLTTLLSRLRGGQTLVLLGSREFEAWLAPESFGDNVYPLPGLDPQAASVLVDRILRRHRATRHVNDPIERDALAKLVELLGGYPLPLTVVLPTLATTTPSTVLADLQHGGITADPVGKIRRAIEYSHGKLDPQTQTSLLLLAPFTAVIPGGPALDHYRDLLLEHDVVRDLGPIDLPAAVQQATDVGLATPHAKLANTSQVQPVLPYFLRARLQDQPELAAAAADAHYQLYTALGSDVLRLLLGRTPTRRAVGQAMARAHYANLTAAVDHALRNSQRISALIPPLNEYLSQTKQQSALIMVLENAIAAYHESRLDQLPELALLHNLAGIAALNAHRLDDAQLHHESELALARRSGDRQMSAAAYGQLGRVAYEQRRFDEAGVYLQQALDIHLEFKDRLNAARSYGELGAVALEQQRFDDATAYYHKTIDIFLEVDDRYHTAPAYHQLGTVAKAQQRYDHATAYYYKAIDICLEFDDRHRAAGAYHQLGIVAEEQQRYEDADTYYRKALDIYLEFDDRHHAGIVYHQLGAVAEAQQRYEEADAQYRNALDVYLEFDDRYSAAGAYHQLGIVAKEQQRYEDVDTYYRKALDIYLELDDPHHAAGIYHQLGILAEEQQRYEHAETYYRKALDIYLELNDRHHAAGIYGLLGFLAQQQQRYEDADTHRRKALDIYLELDDRPAIAGAHFLLAVVAEEQQRYEDADTHGRKALDIFLELDDRADAAGSYQLLGLVAEEQQRHEQAAAHYQNAMEICVHLGDRWNAAIMSVHLGRVLVHLDRTNDVTKMLLYVALIWRQETGVWEVTYLDALRAHRHAVGTENFNDLSKGVLPEDLFRELVGALDDAEDHVTS